MWARALAGQSAPCMEKGFPSPTVITKERALLIFFGGDGAWGWCSTPVNTLWGSRLSTRYRWRYPDSSRHRSVLLCPSLHRAPL